VIFGPQDILINNIAWILRRFPFFVIPGRGDYRLQPTFVEDLASLAVDAGSRSDDYTIDAVGPEIFTFEQLVSVLARILDRKTRIVHAPPRVVFALTRLLGWIVRDVVLTTDEIAGLAQNLLVSAEAPTGRTRLSEWLRANTDAVGRTYASELARHYRRPTRAGGSSARNETRSE
jgi:NADH dehydrogenase